MVYPRTLVQTNVAQAVRTIVAEPLTREAFAPCGDVISAEGHDRLPVNYYGDRMDVYKAGPFESDQPVEFLLTVTRIRDFRVTFLERHMELTQTFIPLAGHPFIIAVAPPDARLEDGVPAFDDVRAFFVPGDVAVNIHRGTWHEPPFPLVDNALTIITSHRALTQGLQTKLDETKEVHRLDVDKRNITERTGVELRVALPY
jgi:ureidoglycolate lyase